jgi:hypothetical protein
MTNAAREGICDLLQKAIDATDKGHLH